MSHIYAHGRRKNKFIKVFAKKKPSRETVGRTGTWVINEWNGVRWVMPCFPEITMPTLDKMVYVGELKEPK